MWARETDRCSFQRLAMRTTVFFLAVFLCLCGQAAAAELEPQMKWSKRYVKDETRELVKKVVAARDGGALVWADETDTAYHILPPLLLKVDAAGEEEWTKRMPEDFWIASVKQAKTSGFLVMGALRSQPEKLQLVRLSETGKTEWTKQIAVEGGAMIPQYYSLLYSDFAETSDGGWIAAGRYYPGGYDTGKKSLVHLVKITASGKVEWDKTWDTPNFSSADRIIITDSKDVYLQGTVSSGDSQLYIAKLTEDAEVIWKHTYDEVGSVTIHSVLPASDGGLLITGYVNRYRYDPAYNDILAWHINAKGDVVWRQQYGEEERGEIGLSLTERADGGYMLIALLGSERNEPSDWSFMTLDDSGNLLDEKTVTFPQVRVIGAVPQGAGEYLLLGQYWEKSTTLADKRDIYLIKYGKAKTLISLQHAYDHKLKLTLGDTTQLQVKAVYDDGTEEALTSAVKWQSSDENVAAVDGDGQITAKQKGKAKITASLEGKSAMFTIQVKK
ncbi:Ig domain-containing protein [Brevibacillus sp. B_LB10_24]|uniref:Ig-like domain-containing protein n=1 Tax=Brevibacillus sp. B_LB10_24 TaxID=3380645 RepID=UPI0038B9702B